MIIHNLERICTTWSCSRYKRKVTKFLVLRFPFSRPRLLPFIFPRITEPYILKELRTSGSHLWIQPVRKWTLSEVVRLLDGTSNDRMEESPMRKNVLRGVITPVDVIHGCETSFSMVHESNARWNHAETEGEQLLAYANAFLICVHSDDIYLKYRVEHFTKRLGNVGSHVSYFPSTSNIEWLLTWLRAACRAFNREREREKKNTSQKKDKKKEEKNKKENGEKIRRKSRSFRDAEKFMCRYGMHKRWTGHVTSWTRSPRTFRSEHICLELLQSALLAPSSVKRMRIWITDETFSKDTPVIGQICTWAGRSNKWFSYRFVIAKWDYIISSLCVDRLEKRVNNSKVVLL